MEQPDSWIQVAEVRGGGGGCDSGPRHREARRSASALPVGSAETILGSNPDPCAGDTPTG